MFTAADVIASYGPLAAIADGQLTLAQDIADSAHAEGIAKEAGFGYRVALTAGAKSLVVPTEAEAAQGQDVSGRLWDVLGMARLFALHKAVKLAQVDGCSEVAFPVSFSLRGRSDYRNGQQDVRLMLGLSCDENLEPIFTIMLPSED